jgi:hypothetical protein
MGNGHHYFLKMSMCGFCLADNFKHNSEEETILCVQYHSSILTCIQKCPFESQARHCHFD